MSKSLNKNKLMLSVTSLLLLGVMTSFAQEAQSDTQRVVKTDSLTQTNKLSLDTVNVGNDDFFTPFVWEGTSSFESEDAMVKEQIDTREFASDPYYMRNIDREEFEQERILMLFRDDKEKKGFKTWTKSSAHIALPGAVPTNYKPDDEEDEGEK